MNDFIFNILPAQGATIPAWLPVLGGFPINSPLVGSFLGVIAGFGIKYAYQSHKTKEDKKIYMKMIKSEIEHCISVLEQDRVQSLPEDKWMSAVNSGALKLFKIDTELQLLSKSYYNIHDFNEKARIEKFIGYDWPRLEREDGNRLPLDRVRPFLQCKKTLLEELKELKDAEWLQTRKGLAKRLIRKDVANL